MGSRTEALLQEFRKTGSEAAFQELVAGYINLVYSVACRRVAGDAHLAEDVVQTVFTDLARKAASLPRNVMLGGWLHRHTCFVASTVMRTNLRRAQREQQAVTMNALADPPDADWKELAPILDEAIDELKEQDRIAIVLRFFESRDLRSVAHALGASEDAAQKRVARALDKLRDLLAKRGVALAIPALTATLATNSISAAPASWTSRISKTAVQNATVPAGVLTAFLASILKPALVTVAIIGAVTALLWQTSSTSDSLTPQVRQNPSNTINAVVSDILGAQEQAAAPQATDGLRLLFMAADSGKPIPNVDVTADGLGDVKRSFIATREGVCDVPLQRDAISHLKLRIRVEGFADTSLEWRPERGEQIPETYTVRMVRPLLIGGRVFDADGLPVADAKVGWNHDEDPAARTYPENHEFIWIEVPTDSEGRWQINRIAPDMFPRLYGSARHADHAGTGLVYVGGDIEVQKALRQQEHVFQLSRAMSVTGIVVDPENRPVAGASVFVGSAGGSDSRKGLTEPDGTFRIASCHPDDTLLSAEAPGFAITTIRVDINSGPFRIQLHPGRKLTLRVVDKQGAPIPRASVWMNQFTDSAPQTEFSRRTDVNGIVVWDAAPQGEMIFATSARGYMEVDKTIVRPGETEKTIALSPALELSGTVRDQNSQPVPRFRIICGRPDADGNTRWTTLDRLWLNFTGGKYRYVFEETLGEANEGYVFKFEAEGHEPFISRVFGLQEGKVNLDVTLRPSTGKIISVLQPDGSPAVSADVGLVSSNSSIEIIPGGLSRNHPYNPTALLRTGLKGEFSFTADPVCQRIIVAHLTGYAEVVPSALLDEPVIQLALWARIEGVFKVNGMPSARRKLWLNLAHGDRHTFQCRRTFGTLTDAQGRFRFPRVPHGRLKLIELVPDRPEAPTSWGHLTLKELTAQPGETVDLTLGGNTCRVAARLSYSENLELPSGTTTHFFLSPHEGETRVYPLIPNPDGTWTANEVAPGKYFFKVNIMHMPTPGVPKFPASGRSRAVINVPADPPTTPIDFGEVVITRPEEP